ncbi:MAG: restriction endonuclease subunit R, partial [Anaerolineae bacterium]|nr:restriction endonuclease subunit R [Anaerolineae bacterium]
MSERPSFREELISQIPALHLLMAMGYTYLTPAEADAQRENSRRYVLLTGILEPWLHAHNRVTYKGQDIPFSEANIRQAIQTLTNEPLTPGLIPANKAVYELLTLGTSLKQTIEGDSKSFSLHYIDWQHPEHNVYHVTDEYVVEKPGTHETRRPDIVLFVNGIPLVVIECKRPDLQTESGKAFEEAVSQMIRNQRADEIPNLFLYSQLLLAVSVNDAYYATTATEKSFWAQWKEEGEEERDWKSRLQELINRPLSELEKQHLYGWRKYSAWIRKYFDGLSHPSSVPGSENHCSGEEAGLPPEG